MNYRIAIIGSREAIEGFSLLGVTTVAASTSEDAVERIKEMKRGSGSGSGSGSDSNPPFAIIFVTEDLAAGFSADDERYFAKDPLPAIIPLPSHLGSTGYSSQRLSRIVERAVGSDILK